MEVIVWIIATIMWAVAYAIAEIRLNNLKSKHYDALHKNIDLETKVNALDKECQMYLDEAVEIAEEKNGIAKYADFLIKQYEEVYEEKRKLEWQNERLREQVEFFERELATEETEKETTNLHKGESK